METESQIVGHLKDKPKQLRLFETLQDGERHKAQKLKDEICHPEAKMKALSGLLFNLRKHLVESELRIVCVYENMNYYYQLIRLYKRAK